MGFTDPTGLANMIIVVGEPDGAGENFQLAAETWIQENTSQNDRVVVLNAKDYKEATSLREAIGSFGDIGIDKMAYFGHSYPEGLTTHPDTFPDRNNSFSQNDAWINSLPNIKFNIGASIHLFGCRAGDTSTSGLNIANFLALQTGAEVFAFNDYSFATQDEKLKNRERAPTENDKLGRVSNKVPVWFLPVNGSNPVRFKR